MASFSQSQPHAHDKQSGSSKPITIPHDSDFSLSNIPFGVFSPPPRSRPASEEGKREEQLVSRHICTRIGDHVLDLYVLAPIVSQNCQPSLTPLEANTLCEPTLNSFARLGRQAVGRVRSCIKGLIIRYTNNDTMFQWPEGSLYEISQVESRMCLPFYIGDYTDFYAGIHHAKNVGRLFRGVGNELQRNYLFLPVGYHGRSSTIFVSGNGKDEVRRPTGQLPPPNSPAQQGPRFGKSEKLDYELELGVFIGVGNEDEEGRPIKREEAWKSIFGYVLLNDWSARDIQSWEYVPLGPFLGKSFATTISPWVVTHEALEPFLTTNSNHSRGEISGAPELLDYLREGESEKSVHDFRLEVYIIPSEVNYTKREEEEEKAKVKEREDRKKKMITSNPLTTASPKYLIYSFPQMIAHHTVNGCILRTGDLLGSGTISGPDIEREVGSLLELSENGTRDVEVVVEGRKHKRRWLMDGDEVVFRGYGVLENGERIGFGECIGKVIKGWD